MADVIGGQYAARNGPKQGVYYVHQQDLPAVTAAVAAMSGSIGDETCFFSSWGARLEPVTDFKPCAHYLAPLDSGFRRLFVLRGALPLPIGPSFASVLATMLRSADADVELYIEVEPEAKSQRVWPSKEDLVRLLPDFSAEQVGAAASLYVHIVRSPSPARRAAPGIYEILAPLWRDYREQVREAGLPAQWAESSPNRTLENEFIYPMQGALQNLDVLEHFFRQWGLPRACRIMDVGGCYGFLACALALHGHHVVNLEAERLPIECIFPWVVERCGVGGRVQGLHCAMEEARPQPGAFDAVCFMGSLLCCRRDSVERVLAWAVDALKPGGLIVVRENLAVAANPRRGDPLDTRFTAAELDDALHSIGLPMRYFCHNVRERAPAELENLWVVYALMQKPHRAARAQ
jgi:SAM-dependent methyltransferase